MDIYKIVVDEQRTYQGFTYLPGEYVIGDEHDPVNKVVSRLTATGMLAQYPVVVRVMPSYTEDAVETKVVVDTEEEEPDSTLIVAEASSAKPAPLPDVTSMTLASLRDYLEQNPDLKPDSLAELLAQEENSSKPRIGVKNLIAELLEA